MMAGRFRSGFCSHEDCAGKKETLLVNVGRKLCFKHNNERLNKGKEKKKPFRKLSKKKREPTGEGAMFSEIAATRQPYCVVCGKHIGEWKAHNFAHILSKAAYPSLRLNPDNLAVLCWDYGQGCHEKFDTGGHGGLREKPEWKNIFDILDKLKENYYL